MRASNVLGQRESPAAGRALKDAVSDRTVPHHQAMVPDLVIWARARLRAGHLAQVETLGLKLVGLYATPMMAEAGSTTCSSPPAAGQLIRAMIAGRDDTLSTIEFLTDKVELFPEGTEPELAALSGCKNVLAHIEGPRARSLEARLERIEGKGPWWWYAPDPLSADYNPRLDPQHPDYDRYLVLYRPWSSCVYGDS